MQIFFDIKKTSKFKIKFRVLILILILRYEEIITFIKTATFLRIKNVEN